MKSEQDRLGIIIEAQWEIASRERDMDSLLDALAQYTITLTGAGAAVVMLPRNDQLVVHTAAGTPSMTIGFSLPIDQSVGGLAYRSRVIQHISDARTDPRAHAPTARAAGLGAIIAAPLISGENVVGVLQLMSQRAGALDETDVRTLEMLAAFAAAAFERARTAEQLLLSEKRVRAILKTAPDPIVVLDSAGKIAGFNPAAERAFLRRRVDVLGESASVLLAPKHVEGFDRWIAGGVSAGSAEYAGQHFRATARRGDGSEFPMEIAVANLPEEMRLSAVFIRDLTVQEKLSESRERLAAVVANAPVILLAVDTNGIVTLAEGRGLANFGLSSATAVGRSLGELIDFQPDGLELLGQALGRETVSGEFHLVRPDRYLEGNLGPIIDGEERVIGASAVLADVTDRVRVHVAQREAEARSRLMAMMNHEVRTPLNSILGFAQLLTNPSTGSLTPKQRTYVDNIRLSGNQLLTLVNDSLDLARLDLQRDRVEIIEFSAQNAVEQAAEQVRPLAEARQLTLEVLTSGADYRVRADPGQLVQVVLNLLSNAIRHTPGGGSVTIEVGRDKGRIAISVIDSGEGIAPDEVGRIFEEFYQASNRAAGGIGLGLAISKRLVERMGGTIEAESEIGRGSRFTVMLKEATTNADTD